MSIEVINISKRFGQFAALDDVTLHVRSGELLALLGPSGSGKTTLLRVIAGLELPDGGDVRFDGESVQDRHVRKRGVGFVFQHYALFRHMTVLENIAFGLRVKPRSERPTRAEIRDRVGELLRLVHLDGLAGRYPHELSGGQRQRVALARALAVRPRVLLLDEPFGALDAKVRAELRDWLRRLHEEIHLTSVFVTHDQDEALEVADRVVVMNRGKIEQIGSPEEVFHAPASSFVMDFLGQVNRFHGRDAGEAARQGSISYVRPHEFELIRPDPSSRPFDKARGEDDLESRGVTGEIARIYSASALVRIELSASDGRIIHVQMSQEEYRRLGASVGQTWTARPRRVRVFTDDYQI